MQLHVIDERNGGVGFSCRFIGIGFATYKVAIIVGDHQFQLQVYWDRLCNYSGLS